MRCNQELYGHINCDRDVIAGEEYCKFHFVPFLRIKIEKLQAENAKLRECVEFYANEKTWFEERIIGYPIALDDEGGLARKVLKQLNNTDRVINPV